jgi:hypothetical protein
MHGMGWNRLVKNDQLAWWFEIVLNIGRDSTLPAVNGYARSLMLQPDIVLHVLFSALVEKLCICISSVKLCLMVV